MKRNVDTHAAAVFIKALADAIIQARDNGIPMEVMEHAFEHAWMHVYLLNMKDTPPIPDGNKPAHQSNDIDQTCEGYRPQTNNEEL